METTAPDIWGEFAGKVDRVLTSSADREGILEGLRSLAEGKPATLPGTEIQPLSGLGGETSMSEATRYTSTLTRILAWGMSAFPFKTTYEGAHLWITMQTFDGPRGYNQLLLPHEAVSDTRVETEHGSYILPSSSLPRMVHRDQSEGIRPLETDLQYVKDHLHQNPNARSVVATAFDFGWEKVFVHCTCLYVDIEGSKEDLILLATQQDTPTIVMDGRLSNLTVAEDANQLLGLPKDNLDASERLAVLRGSLPNPSRVVEDEGPFHNGQSISLAGSESRGSAGVFLVAADDGDDDEVYMLTAGHTVSDPPEESRVITPGLLDILGKFAQAHPDYSSTDQIKFLVERSRQECGQVETSSIGVNKDGWRCDLGLVRLFEPWKTTSNGNWFNTQQTADVCLRNRALFPEGFIGSGGVAKNRDAQAHQTCVKDGATTGCTPGIIGHTEAQVFVKGTADVAPPQMGPSMIEISKVVILNPTGPGNVVCKPGDSGAGVFCPMPRNEWAFSGLLVSQLMTDNMELGMMIPQTQVFSSLREITGKTWRLAGM